MKLTKILFFLLPLLLSALACTLTVSRQGSTTAKPTPTPPPQGGAAAIDAQVAQAVKPTQAAPATIPPSPTPKTCQVKTGLPEGRLNLRACGRMDCPILATVNEGETLTLTKPQPATGWLAVETADGLAGWVNSQFTNCEGK